ncbi:hypothetical protein SRABI128_03299 [Microbacterium sp. Bi128]|nr:hypothetical protein SRABI128_03299 [Microbacterium sp. Bi128]
MTEGGLQRAQEQVGLDAVPVLEERHHGAALERHVAGVRQGRERHRHGHRCRRCVRRSPAMRLALLGAVGTACGAFDSALHLGDVEAQATSEHADVPGPQRGVADVGHDRCGGAQGTGAPLDAGEVVVLQALIDHELEHRRLGVHERAHRAVAALQTQIARVESVGSDRHVGLRGEPLLVGEGAQRGLLPRRIRVEREDHFSRCAVVTHHAAEHRDVVGAEGGAARCDRGRDPREVAGHDVGVPLDDDDPVLARDVALGQIEAVQHLGFLVDRRLGGVQILRALIVVVELARAEADDLTGDVADGPHDAAAESVVHPALPLRHEACLHELVARELLREQVIHERGPPLRRVSHAEVRRGSRVETAVAEEAPRGVGLGRHQLRAEVLGGGGVRGVQPRASGRLGCGATVLVVQRVSHARGHALDGLGERDVVHRAEERIHVAGLAAAEAVVVTHLRAHVETGAALVMEGTQSLHRPHTGRFERDALTDDVGDVDPRLDLVDVGLPDAPAHQASAPRGGRAPGAQTPSSAASTSPTRRPCQAMASWSVRLAT